MAKLYAFDIAKHKKILVGEVQGTALFKTVEPSKHFMRRVGGYGISYDAFKALTPNGINKIIIKETTGNQWIADLKTWKEHNLTADYGSGKQVFLSLKYMTLKKKIVPAFFEPVSYVEEPKKEPEPKQEELF